MILQDEPGVPCEAASRGRFLPSSDGGETVNGFGRTWFPR